jgi:trans-aconitate methyltransferase
VEPNAVAAKWSKFLLMIGGVDAEIIQADPSHWRSEQTFDRIVCNTPFGFRQDQTQLLASIIPRLSSAGQLLLMVPPAFLWEQRNISGIGNRSESFQNGNHRPTSRALDVFSDMGQLSMIHLKA